MTHCSRGRTTTGMVAACLISTILTQESNWDPAYLEEGDLTPSDPLEGPSPEEVYTQGKLANAFQEDFVLWGIGEYKVILQLIGVLSFGKISKRITDEAIDLMQGTCVCNSGVSSS
jgi:hypothetical protein